MRLQPYAKPNPIAAVLQGLTQVVQQQNQQKMQEYMLRRQAQQEQYERQRQGTLDAQRDEERQYQRGRDQQQDARMLNFGAASDVPNPDDFENPAPLVELRNRLRQGVQPTPRPAQSFGLPGIAAPGGPALPFTLPAASGVRSALDQAGRRVQDVRNETTQNALLARQREGDAAAAAREAARQEAITQRAEYAAQKRAELEAQKAGFQAGTKAFDAFVQSHRKFYSEALKEVNDPALANEMAVGSARESVKGGAAYLSPQARPQIDASPFPDFTGRLPKFMSERKVEVSERNADTSAFRAETDATHKDRTLGLNLKKHEATLKRLGLDEKKYLETVRHNQAMEARNTTSGAALAKKNAAAPGSVSRVDEIQLIRLRQDITTLTREVNKNRPAAQAGDTAAMERLAMGEAGLKEKLAAERAILDRYEPKAPTSVKPKWEAGMTLSAVERNYIKGARDRGISEADIRAKFKARFGK